MPLETLKLVFLLCCWILLFCPLRNAAFCGSTKTLTVSEGDDIILRSDYNPSLSYITWDFEKHLIAITEPSRPLQLAEYSFKYSGRLSSSTDGSLIIKNLIAEDERIYRADLFDVNYRYLCVQVYDLRMEEHGGIFPNVDPPESCGSTKHFLFRLGERITLKLPSRRRVAYVQWDINNIDHIAITRPGGIMDRPFPSYHGRISAVGDGSLALYDLTTKDQQVYRAKHFTNQWRLLCEQYYDVKVKSRSLDIDEPPPTPSISTTFPASPTSGPSHSPGRSLYTNEPPPTPSIFTTFPASPTSGPSHSPGIVEKLPGNHGLQIYIRLALSGCILIATFSILFYHIKTEIYRTPQYYQIQY